MDVPGPESSDVAMTARAAAGDQSAFEARVFASDIAFSSAVKKVQSEKGSRASYARMEQGAGWKTTVPPKLEAFLF